MISSRFLRSGIRFSSQLRFDDKVAIVTGAGAGLGKEYALQFASRGASVIVNDLGGARDGDGASTSAADAVVDLIKSNGGKATANYNSVTDGVEIVKTAVDTYGKVDIVINNAGILRDRSLLRISPEGKLIYRVRIQIRIKIGNQSSTSIYLVPSVFLR